jgi:cell division topological specificity factor
MDVFERIFGRPFGSATVAKKRLQLVLTQDRTNISPEALNLIKDDIIAAISKHVDIDAQNVQVAISSDDAGHRLTANIPVFGTRSMRTPKSRA